MRKISEDLENPIDNFIYIFVELLAPYAYQVGLTPNMITTLSVLASIISIYYLYMHYFIISIVFYILSYFFDCLDGYVARKYKMISKFGDLYDHISDVISFVGYIATLYIVNSKLLLLFSPIILYILFLSQIHLAYQELYYNKKAESYSLHILTSLFASKRVPKNEIINIMKHTRYFGLGTFHFVIVLIVLAYSLFYNSFS